MKHKDKVKMAKKMLTKLERKHKTPIFQSDAWENRANAIKAKVKQKIESKKK